MVKKYIIDCKELCERRAAHLYLKEALELPEYYGKNLDALYDCLTEKEECMILLKGSDGLYEAGGYGVRILKVMINAAIANPLLKLDDSEAEAAESNEEEADPAEDNTNPS